MFVKLTNIAGVELCINTTQIVLMRDTCVTMSTGLTLEFNEENTKKLNDILFPVKRTRKNQSNTELANLFDKLHALTGGKGKAVFTLGREKKLDELLKKHRMTEEALITAATNLGKDAFMQGENPQNKRYGDIDYLLRPDKAAKYSEETTEKKKRMF